MLAVNQTGAGGATPGDVYVAEGLGQRISVFSGTGAFIRAFGLSVVPGSAEGTGSITLNSTEVTSVVTTKRAFLVGQTVTGSGIPSGTTITTVTTGVGAASKLTLSQAATETKAGDVFTVAESPGNVPVNEQQTVTVKATGGTFTLSFATTSPTASATTAAINFNASATEVQSALEALANVGSSNVEVTGGPGDEAGSSPYVVSFKGALADTNVAQLTASSTALAGGVHTATPATTREGARAAESCTSSCVTGIASGQAGSVNAPQGIAIDQQTGNVYITTSTNRRVDVFSALGTFEGAFGWKVNAGTPEEKLQFCTAATTCQPGPTTATITPSAGAFGLLSPSLPAVDPTSGAIYVPDPGNLRMDEFMPTLNGSKEVTGVSFVRAFGWNVNLSTPEPKLQECTSITGCQKGSKGNGLGQFRNEAPTSAAVDSTGAIYAMSSTFGCSVAEPCRVWKFSTDLSSVQEFAPTSLSFTSGTFANEAALAVAVDPSNDNVLFAKKVGASEYRVLEFDSSGTLLSTTPSTGANALAGSGTTNYGLAVGTESRAYLAAVGTAPQGQVYILGPVSAPGVKILPVTMPVGETTATFNGEVTVPEPGGEEAFNTHYHFEYSANGIKWTSGQIGSVGNVAGTYQIHETTSGLTPNTEYSVRLVATTGPSATSSIETFTTKSAAPLMLETYANPVEKTTATLNALINPQHSATTYHFEWATQAEWEETGAYGHRIPALIERKVGSGSEPIIAQEELPGLEADATYHFRVVASNHCNTALPSELCTTTGPDQQFTTLNAAGLPDSRGIELVSPADKRPIGMVTRFLAFQLQFQVADDGQSVVYPLLNGLTDATAGGELRYMATRGEESWNSEQVSAPSLVPASQDGFASVPSYVRWYSPDLSCGVLESNQPLNAEVPAEDFEDHQVTNLFVRKADGTYTLISKTVPQNPDLKTVFYYLVAGASDDCGRVVFKTAYALLPGASGFYEWDHGVLRDTGVRPDGTILPMGPNPSSEPGFGDEGFGGSRHNSVSGDRLFFTGTSNEGGDSGKKAVFVRKGGAVASGSGDLAASSTAVTNVATATGAFVAGQTITGTGIPAGTVIATVGPGTLTLSQAATATGSGVVLKANEVVDASLKQGGANNSLEANYEIASRDGSHVFFTSNYGLTPTSSSGASACTLAPAGTPNGDGCDLYDYNVGTRTLKDLSANSASTNPKGASVAGVVDVSADGSWVYFAAKGQLVPGKGKAYEQNNSEHFVNLYLWHSDQLAYVATINRDDLAASSGGGTHGNGALVRFPGGWNAQATPGGRHLLFDSVANVTGYDSGGKLEAYVFSADSGRTVCVSCRPDGLPSVGYASDQIIKYPPNPATDSQLNTALYVPRAISDSGQRIFFTMPDVLAPGAVSGQPNAYEWENGQVSLLAPESAFQEASASGADAFLVSANQLDPHDTDHVQDLYDFRVSGGFPPPPVPTVSCDPATGECQGAASSAPAAPSSASAGFSGPGNPPIAASKCPHGKIRRHGHCVRKAKKRRHSHKRGANTKRTNNHRGGAK